MSIDTERLKTNRAYWDRVAPANATHFGLISTTYGDNRLVWFKIEAATFLYQFQGWRIADWKDGHGEVIVWCGGILHPKPLEYILPGISPRTTEPNDPGLEEITKHLSDRELSVIRFALRRFIAESYYRAGAAGQKRSHATVEEFNAFYDDAKTAEICLMLFGEEKMEAHIER